MGMRNSCIEFYDDDTKNSVGIRAFEDFSFSITWDQSEADEDGDFRTYTNMEIEDMKAFHRSLGRHIEDYEEYRKTKK